MAVEWVKSNVDHLLITDHPVDHPVAVDDINQINIVFFSGVCESCKNGLKLQL